MHYLPSSQLKLQSKRLYRGYFIVAAMILTRYGVKTYGYHAIIGAILGPSRIHKPSYDVPCRSISLCILTKQSAKSRMQ